MEQITLTGWDEGLNKVALSKLLRDQAGLSLSEAKYSVDHLLNGDDVVIDLKSEQKALDILSKAVELGAIGNVSTESE